MEFLIVLAILVAVAFVITGPLRRGPSQPGSESTADQVARVREGELAELAAAREAKYREIRDAELDHGTGKLSDADFDALNSVLRAEALSILDAIERVRRSGAGGEDETAGPDEDRARAREVD